MRSCAPIRAAPAATARRSASPTYNDWGGKDYEDIMSGVDHVIAMGLADPDRLGVMGWSYGGFMTSWIITQTSASGRRGRRRRHQPWSFTGTADIPGFLPDYFGGEPWRAVRKLSASTRRCPMSATSARPR